MRREYHSVQSCSISGIRDDRGGCDATEGARLPQNPADFETILKDLRKQRYYAGEVAGRRASEEVFQMLISIAALQNEEERKQDLY